MNKMYTHDELAQMKRNLDDKLNNIQRNNPNARPLPPMLESEARDMLITLFDAATTRMLTPDEGLLMGQLLATYRMAVEARMLKHEGRYFVIDEASLAGLLG